MRYKLTSPATLGAFALGIAVSLAEPAANAEEPRACDQIIHICKQAGFVEGDYKKGYGLWLDCIDPIMRGMKQPAIADKPLPQVSAELIAACRQKDPNFGQRRGPLPKGG
jgi:hypothetical protein